MFHFRLQTLLRLRIAERDQRRAELAKAIRAEELLREEDAKLAEQQAEAAERRRLLKSPGAADVDALLQTHRYEVVLAAQRRQLAAQISQVQAETESPPPGAGRGRSPGSRPGKTPRSASRGSSPRSRTQAAKQFDEMAAVGLSSGGRRCAS